MAYDVTCVIPRWGRIFQNVMKKMAMLSPDKAEIDRVRALVVAGKEHASADPVVAKQYLDALDSPYLTLAPDRKRSERYYRVGFLGMEIGLMIWSSAWRMNPITVLPD